MAQMQAMQFQTQMSQQMMWTRSVRRADMERRRANQTHQLESRAMGQANVEKPLPMPASEAWRGPKSSEAFFPILFDDTLVLLNRDEDRVLGVDQASGKTKWEYPLNKSGLEINPLRIGDEVLLVNKAFEAVLLDPSTGKAGKTMLLADGDLVLSPGGKHPEVLFPTLSGRVLLLAIRGMKKPEAPGVLVAFDTAAGKRLWAAPLPESPDLDPLVSGQLVITGGAGKVRAFQIADGKSAWTRDLGHTDPLSGNVAMGKDRIAICGHGHLLALTAATGEIAWDQPFHGEPMLIPEGERLFYLERRGAFSHHVLVGLDEATGAKVWEAPTRIWEPQTSVAQLPWIADGRVVLVDDDFGLKAFDAESGKALWHSRTILQPLQLGLQGTADRLYSVKYDKRKAYIESIDLGTGKLAWTYPIDEDASRNGMLLVGEKELYFPAPKGVFLCLR
jgi:outer membrane protein assembly factor BamB